MKIQDETFRILIEQAVDRLAPYFGLTNEEIEEAKKFEIRRELKGVYKKHSKRAPAYSYLDNFFFFPKRQYGWADFQIVYPSFNRVDFEKILGLTKEGVINHETGHRLHALVNPQMKEGFIQFLEIGKRPDFHQDLTEMIAEYGNMITGKRDYQYGPFRYLHLYNYKNFKKFGPSFLKELARMPLQEAIDRKLFDN